MNYALVGNSMHFAKSLLSVLIVTQAWALTLTGHDVKKVAFLVGIDKYQKSNFDNLNWAERDVEDLAKRLEQMGFKVVALKGSSSGFQKATLANIQRELPELLKGVGKEDVVLVALSGHGQQLEVQQNGKVVLESFFCPWDAVDGDETTLLRFNYLLHDLLAKRGGKNLVLVDACRDESQGIPGGVITLPEDTAVLFSCRAGQRSCENKELQHGLFTYCVLDVINTLAARLAFPRSMYHSE